MEIIDKNLDGGKAFDWGKTSADYARYRDIYPEEFYEKIRQRNLCIRGQHVLDLGTGTGVIPRNMYQDGAKWIEKWEKEHIKLLEEIAPEQFDILHYAAIAELKKK